MASIFDTTGGISSIPLPGFMSPQGTAPPVVTSAPAGVTGAASSALGGIGGLGQYNYYGSLYPQVGAIGQGMVNDPNAMAYLQAAQGGSELGQAGALGAYGAGANLYGLGGPVMQSAFDPQQQLYQRTAQQVADQSLAGLYGSGLQSTPWGQGVLGKTMGDFNINWQNQQLGRQLQGVNALQSLYPQAAAMQAGAAGQYGQFGGMPWMTGQQIGGAGLGTLGTMAGFGTQGAQLPQQQIQNYMNYLGWATPAEQQAYNQMQTSMFTDPNMLSQQYNQIQQNYFNAEMQRQQAANQQSASTWGGLGKIAGTIGGGALGFMAGGPMGALAGASLGGSIFGGGAGGGGGTPGAGYSPYNYLPTSWGSPGGGYFPSNYAVYQYGGEPTPGKPAMVGEEGPEIFIPHTPGTIIPNPKTQQRMGGMGQMGGGMGGGGLPGLSGMPGDLPSSPYPMPGVTEPYATGMAGIGAMGNNFGFKRDHGMGWQYGGGMS
jgi:hypothetical protein